MAEERTPDELADEPAVVEEPTPDERADEIAAQQHGVISRRQASDVGLTRHQIERRLASGRWRRAARAVFVVAAVPETWMQRVMVICLAGPPGTVASHLTAAALSGLVEPPQVPHVTVVSGATNRLVGAVVHRVRQPIDARDLSIVDGVPSTSVARTLVDCAGVLAYDSLCELIDVALIRRVTTASDLRAAVTRVARAPGRKGVPLIDQALQVWSSGRRPDSPPEIKLQRLMLSWGFPAPVRQHPVFDTGGRFVAKADLAVPGIKLILEYDGQEFHGPRRKDADGARQARLQALGWTVVRVTRNDLRHPARLQARLQALAGDHAA
ncbi:MAG: type IV toxin-antitoxin system AbiEi family antitoxin domain-containing protein [Acidimicrobiia bacterium]